MDTAIKNNTKKSPNFSFLSDNRTSLILFMAFEYLV